MRNLVIGGVMVASLFLSGARATAQNVVRLDGVAYELVRGNATFPQADNAARARLLAGTNKRGTLAVLDTPRKQAFIQQAFGNQLNGVFLGAQRGQNGLLYWQNGVLVQSNMWSPGEPNNFKGRESVLEFRVINGGPGLNDISPNQLNSYLVEYR